MKTALESDSGNNGPQAVINNLQNSLVQAVQQNNELRTRLNNIHTSSDISDIVEPVSYRRVLYFINCVYSDIEIPKLAKLILKSGQ